MKIALDVLGYGVHLDLAPRYQVLGELLAAARPRAARPADSAHAVPAAAEDVVDARLDDDRRTAPPPGLRLGRRVAVDDHRVSALALADMSGLRVDVSRRSGRPFEVRVSYRQNKVLEEIRARYKGVPVRSLQQNLLYFAVFFPAMLLAEENGAAVAHGAAVDARGRTWLVSGLGGSGKSTLALGFLAEREARMSSDNIVVVGPDGLCGVPELVRLDPASLALLPSGSGDRLRRVKHGAEHGRGFVDLPGLGEPLGRVDVVMHVSLGTTLRVTEMSCGECARRQVSLDSLALEMLAYQQFASVVELAGIGAGAGESRVGRLEAAFAGARCFGVTVPKGEPLATVIDTIEEAVTS
jgi:hypothetical protein